MKTTIVAVMIACVLPIPQNPCQSAPVDPPKKEVIAVVACIGVAVAGTIIYGLWKLCQKIPDPNAPPVDPPVTNQPITQVNWTNRYGPGWRGLYPPPGYVSPKGFFQSSIPVRVSSIAPIPFDTAAWPASPDSGSQPPLISRGTFDRYWSAKMQASDDMTNWATFCTVRAFETLTNGVFESGQTKDAAGTLLNVYRGDYDPVTNNVPVFSGYRSDYSQECVIPQDCIAITGNKPKEFFRWVQN